MNKDYGIYEMTSEQLAKLAGESTDDEAAELREDAARYDAARYDGYKRAFEEAEEALAKAKRPNSDLTRRRQS